MKGPPGWGMHAFPVESGGGESDARVPHLGDGDGDGQGSLYHNPTMPSDISR